MERIEQKIWNVGISAFVFSFYLVTRVLYETKLPAAYSEFTMSMFGHFDLYLALLIPYILTLIVSVQFIRIIKFEISIFDAITISVPVSLWHFHFGLCNPISPYVLLMAITSPFFTYVILNHFPKPIYSSRPLIPDPDSYLKILITLFLNSVLIIFFLTAANGIHSFFQVILLLLILISITARIKNSKIWNTLFALSVLVFTYLVFTGYPIFLSAHSDTFDCV